MRAASSFASISGTWWTTSTFSPKSLLGTFIPHSVERPSVTHRLIPPSSRDTRRYPMRSTVATASPARRPSSSHATTWVPLNGTAGGTRNSSCRRAIRLAPGMWLLLYSPASLTSISAKGALPSRRPLSVWGAILSVIVLPPRDEAPEHRAVLEAVALGVLGGVLLHALADRVARRHVEAGHLTLVADQPGDLPVDRVGDVDDDVGLVHAPVPDLAHFVRLEPVPRDLLGEVQMVAGVGGDGVGRHEAGLAMIAVLKALDPIGVVDEDGVGPIPAGSGHDVTEKLTGVFEPAVGVAEHDDVPDAHEVRGGALLLGPLPRERGRRQRPIGGAGGAIGTQHVRDLAPRGRPLGHDAAGADLGVVGVGEDHHRLVRDIGHDLELGSIGVSWHETILQDEVSYRHYDQPIVPSGPVQSPRPDARPGRAHVCAAAGRLGGARHQDRDARRAHRRRYGRQPPWLRLSESAP